MNIIKNLENNIVEVRSLINNEASSLASDPDSRGNQLSMASLSNHLEDLQQQLYIEKSSREVEVIELRLKGNRAIYGSLPLKLISDISKHISNTFQAASFRIWKGEELMRRAPNDLIELLNLRLNGLAPGSTKMIISGSTNPDLFGDSLLEETLTQSFELLNSENAEQASDAIAALGSRSTAHLNRLLKTFINNKLEADLIWQTPSNKLVAWNGTSQKIETLSMTLSQIEFNAPERINIDGVIMLLSAKGKGKIEIKTNAGQDLICSVAASLSSQMGELNLNQKISCVIERESFYNEVTGFEKSSDTLIEILAVNNKPIPEIENKLF